MPKSIKGVMDEWKAGALHSGSKNGPVVKNQKQAVAIALAEQKQKRKKKSRTPSYNVNSALTVRR